jgi:hypothetical protein
MSSERPQTQVAVIMRRERVTGALARWQDWRWTLHDVAEQRPEFGVDVRCIYDGDDAQHWLHPNFTVQLFKDDAEGYYLNATTQAPCWFVLWRMEEEPSITSEPMAKPEMVSLSYHDAGRWLDAQETVEQVRAPDHIVAWMAQFAQDHFTVESKKRKRPESFKRLEDRFGNPVSISTGPKYGGAHEGGSS